jgi:hypothetical protein
MTVFDAATFLARPKAAQPLPPDSHIYAADVRFVPPLLRAARRPRGVRKLGLAYEQRVSDVLSAIYGSQFRPSPTIQYSRHGRRRFAIPDGILYWRDLAIVVEVKLAHTELVWDQLIERYRPLVRLLHPTLKVRTVEICRSYDPAINIPHSRITSLHSGCSPGLEVLLWRI